MYQLTFFDHYPLWMVLAGSAALVLLASEAGFRLGRRRAARLAAGETIHLGAAVASTLGLLAFMLAFTFGVGTDRMDAKRGLVLAHTNAIGTAFLRADLLPEPHRSRSRELLVQYTEELIDRAATDSNRLFGSGVVAYMEKLNAGIAITGGMHRQLWEEAMAGTAADPKPANSLYIASVNEVIDTLQNRVTVSIQQRMPAAFWIVLYTLAVLALGLVGYEAGANRSRHNLSMWVVAVAFAGVLYLVVALDRPEASAVSQLPLQELLRDLRAGL